MSPPDIATLVARARDGNARAVGRLISLVENGSSHLREAMAALASGVGHARVIGLTGSPGVGKSTTTAALVSAFRARGERVGVLAVDPSSPFSGGALLGDRVRMQEHALDDGVYIRSMASRGHLGGLAWSTPQALRVLDAAGCDVVLVAPGMGDGIQAAKAGILEIADVFVVNKADREGADATARDLRHMLSLVEGRDAGEWQPPIVKTVASRHEGIDDLMAALDKHQAWLEQSGHLDARRRVRAADEIEAIALTALRTRLGGLRDGTLLDELAGQVVAGETDPYAAADRLVEGISPGNSSAS